MQIHELNTLLRKPSETDYLAIDTGFDTAKIGANKFVLQENYGEPGQLLRTNGDGSTEWVEEGLPTDEQTAQAVNDWLDAHPDATTTVQDGSITEVKLSAALKNKVINYYVTPEMFGAAGDGVTDDSTAVAAALSSGLPVVCINKYLISGTLYVENSIEMFDDSMFVFGESVEYGVVICGTGTQRLRRRYKINVDANGKAEVGIACGAVKNSILILNVINSADIGIKADYGVGGNNENEYTCHVIGKPDGTSEVGVLVNNYDSIYTTINTYNVKYGAKVSSGTLDVNEIHSWLTPTDGVTNYWEDSAVLYINGGFTATVGLLYQDTVRYGVYLQSSGYVSVNKFVENNTQYSGVLTPKNVKIESHQGSYSNITANMFFRETSNNDPNQYMTFEGVSHYAQYGCYMECNKGYDMTRAVLDFTDLNDAPTIGNFYLKYNVTNLPVGVNSVVKCEVIGNLAFQTVYRLTGATVIYKRFRTLSSDTWGAWMSIPIS